MVFFFAIKKKRMALQKKQNNKKNITKPISALRTSQVKRVLTPRHLSIDEHAGGAPCLKLRRLEGGFLEERIDGTSCIYTITLQRYK
jgi:hypothetical protein